MQMVREGGGRESVTGGWGGRVAKASDMGLIIFECVYSVNR